jgi:hypothetical protein
MIAVEIARASAARIAGAEDGDVSARRAWLALRSQYDLGAAGGAEGRYWVGAIRGKEFSKGQITELLAAPQADAPNGGRNT